MRPRHASAQDGMVLWGPDGDAVVCNAGGPLGADSVGPEDEDTVETALILGLVTLCGPEELSRLKDPPMPGPGGGGG